MNYQLQTLTKHSSVYKSHEAKQCTLTQQSEESPLQRFIDYSFLSHSSVVHNLDIDQQSKVYHSAFTVHFVVRVFSEKRQVWSSLSDIVFFCLTKRKQKKDGIIFLWDKAFPNCAYTVDRETTKFPDMLSSAKVCAQLRGDAAETGRQFFVVVIYYCYFHQL